MADRPPTAPEWMERSNWVRLRTLIVLRWIAIAGQVAAITVAELAFGLALPVTLCVLAIGASVLANLVASLAFPENRRLTETETMLTLLFDVSQLAFLLFLTGGLNNPFALLIAAPVTISAAALALRPTLALGGAAILLATVLALVHVPLHGPGGGVLELPAIFLFGFWAAIVTGILFLAVYARRVTSEINSMSDALQATQMALAREQKLTDLGGVVAATAHELGTPLATIKLVSTEMIAELGETGELGEDAVLIRDQAERCRSILTSMGRAGKDDRHMRTAPLGAVIEEAAEPHADRGAGIAMEFAPGPGGAPAQPIVARRPEIVHALRNLIQNAVDFAATTVRIEASWTPERIALTVSDDGPGFAPQLLGRLGDPFLRARAGAADAPARTAEGGMGLGLFIAKTLLERSGARVAFANGGGPARRGAVVEVSWPAARIVAEAPGSALGRNAPHAS